MNNKTLTTPAVPTFPVTTVSAQDLELWRGERCLFDDLSFSLDRPVLHVRGANGSGKTTLLKVLCGLTSTERGNVTWCHDQRECTPGQMRGLLTYSGHQDALNPALTVEENLAWGAGLFGSISASDIHKTCLQHDLDFLLPQLAGSLSAGQRRRVALLRSVLSDVPVWIWDEPYANLDAAGVSWVNALIDAHVIRGGCLILSAHQLPTLSSDHVQSLELGS